IQKQQWAQGKCHENAFPPHGIQQSCRNGSASSGSGCVCVGARTTAETAKNERSAGRACGLPAINIGFDERQSRSRRRLASPVEGSSCARHWTDGGTETLDGKGSKQ